MPVNTEGFAELVGQIEKMAHRLNTDEEGAPTAKRIRYALQTRGIARAIRG